MDTTILIKIFIWTFGIIDALIVLGGIWFFVWITWLDKRIRIFIIYPSKRIDMLKLNAKDNIFLIDKKKYVVEENAIYRRHLRIPYVFYYHNNPKPIQFSKDSTKYQGADEIRKILDTDFTLKLLKEPINLKKIVMGMAIVIVIGIVALLILHFTGIIDLKQWFSSLNPPPAK
jgi:hypothetical protein